MQTVFFQQNFERKRKAASQYFWGSDKNFRDGCFLGYGRKPETQEFLKRFV